MMEFMLAIISTIFAFSVGSNTMVVDKCWCSRHAVGMILVDLLCHTLYNPTGDKQNYCRTIIKTQNIASTELWLYTLSSVFLLLHDGVHVHVYTCTCMCLNVLAVLVDHV